MAAGACAVFLHAWLKDEMTFECLPAWEYYPVLDEIAREQTLLYPSDTLDRLHIGKQYESRHMPPTRYINFKRPDGGGALAVNGGEDLLSVVTAELKTLRRDATRKGLAMDDVMIKQGGTWGGDAVRRVAAVAGPVAAAIAQDTVGPLPPNAGGVTVLLQPFLRVAAEVRWVVLDGQLWGKQWLSLAPPKRDAIAGGKNAHYIGAADCYKSLRDAGIAANRAERDRYEESLKAKVIDVVREARDDAAQRGGATPALLRVDLLVCEDGRAWLGERDSWGADVAPWGAACDLMISAALRAEAKRAPA